MSRRRWTAAALGLLVVVAIAVGIVANRSGGDDPPTTTTTTAIPATSSTSSTTTTTTTTTTATTTTTTSTTLPHVILDTTGVVWPTAASRTRFTDPVAAARSFATAYLGFVNPSLGAFEPGPGGSGQVQVRPRAAAANVTRVQLRQLEPDHDWWVAGSTASDIEVARPAPLDAIVSPVPLEGRSTAFEGTVSVEVRADDIASPLASSFVTGGSTSDLGPFSGRIAFTAPGSTATGAIVLSTSSAEDGSLIGASVVRVRFG
jgi:hypothetical protein